MPPLRICVIGAGDWASRMHLPVLRRLAGRGELVCPAVCDLDRARAESYAGGLGAAAVFGDASAMLDACRPDGVAILVPPPVTPSVIALAAERGIPFLTEKPPATTAAEHARLIDKVGGLPHVVGYNRRHAPYMLRARDWLAGQPIQSVTALFSRHRRLDPDFSTTAVHAIDAVRFLAGDELARLRIEVAPAGRAANYFLAGWTAGGTRIDLLITPDTASAAEHYVVRSADRTAVVAFPMSRMIDLPGGVELHEANRVAARLGPGDFGLAPDDLPGLGGILGEHELFCRAVRGQAAADSTLAATLGTQRVREELYRLVQLGGRQTAETQFDR